MIACADFIIHLNEHFRSFVPQPLALRQNEPSGDGSGNSTELHALFISKTFINNVRLKLAKYQAKPQQHPEVELWLFEIYSLSSSTLSSKNNKRYSKKCTKNKYDCLIELVWLMTMKMRLKMKNISQRYDTNTPRPHGHKYSKY